ncbi:M48 family metalloprotease [Halanaerobaculum tunisiense]
MYEFNLSSKVNSANAAVMGMGQTRKIILGDNLQEKYNNSEIEAVLAHEIGIKIFLSCWPCNLAVY